MLIIYYPYACEIVIFIFSNKSGLQGGPQGRMQGGERAPMLHCKQKQLRTCASCKHSLWKVIIISNNINIWNS